MNTFDDIWRKLAKSKKYREEFALAFLKRSVPFQVKTLRKKHCGSQAVLAERAKLTQGVVSRAEDQDYGNLTFNTVGRIAAGLDMAFIGRFVPFSELVNFSLGLSEEAFTAIPTFNEEMNTVGVTSTASENIPLEDRASTEGINPHARIPTTAPTHRGMWFKISARLYGPEERFLQPTKIVEEPVSIGSLVPTVRQQENPLYD